MDFLASHGDFRGQLFCGPQGLLGNQQGLLGFSFVPSGVIMGNFRVFVEDSVILCSFSCVFFKSLGENLGSL